MPRRTTHLATLPLLLAACGDELVAPDPLVSACPLVAPVRLAAPPAGWSRRAARTYPFRVLGDRLLYSFDEPDDPDPAYWLVHRCGGAPRRFTTFVPGMRLPLALDTDAGPLVYAVDRDRRHVLLDRLDVPGFDVPRPIADLPSYDVPGASAHEAGFVLFARVNRPPGDAFEAADVGAASYVMHTHDGDPDAPALPLGDDVVSLAHRDGRVLVLTDDGLLREVDPLTGDDELLQSRVRYFTLSPDHRRLIWQALGDDDAEPVFLRALDRRPRLAATGGGHDRQIAVNEFAARSWNRAPGYGRDVGRWSWTDDSSAAALIGLDGTFVAAVRADTGEPLDIPEHREQRGPLGDGFVLVLPSADTQVLALWRPLTGVMRVWYRGPTDAAVTPRALDGDTLDYFLADAADPEVGSLRRIDLRTGALHQRVPRIGQHYEQLDDRRYFTAIRAEPVHAGVAVRWTYDLLVFDADTRVYTTIAERVDDFARAPDQGIFYLDSRGPDPGLWVAPLSPH
jgi:hypothetical protein